MEQSLEDQFYAENDRLRCEMSIPDGEFYHFDTPCTIENQISMFKQAGFATAEMVSRKENNTIIITKKWSKIINLWSGEVLSGSLHKSPDCDFLPQ